jgi:4-amino-4-deoxy-L-arabinose transferase-like glycosyltransferase
VGVLLPLAMALATRAADREIGRWRGFAPLAGPALFLAVAGAWIGLTIVAGPAEYSVWGAFREHFLERTIQGMPHRQPPWYFLQVLPGHLFPWTGLMAGAYLLAWRRRDAGDRFLMTASLILLVIFSISTEKRGLYMLPAYPAFALLAARFAMHILEGGPGREPPVSGRWLTGGQIAVGGVMALSGLALPVVLRGEVDAPYWIVLGVAAIFVVAGAATLAAVWRGQRPAALFAPAAGALAGYLLVSTALFPAMNPFKSGRPFALTIKEVTAESRAAGETVLAFNTGNLPEAWAFYSDGVYTVETVDPERLIRGQRGQHGPPARRASQSDSRHRPHESQPPGGATPGQPLTACLPAADDSLNRLRGPRSDPFRVWHPQARTLR